MSNGMKTSQQAFDTIVIRPLSILFGSKRFSDEWSKTEYYKSYYEVCGGFTASELKEAVHKVKCNCKFWPKPAELKEFCLEARENQRPKSSSRYISKPDPMIFINDALKYKVTLRAKRDGWYRKLERFYYNNQRQPNDEEIKELIEADLSEREALMKLKKENQFEGDSPLLGGGDKNWKALISLGETQVARG